MREVVAKYLSRHGYQVVDIAQIKNTIIAWERKTDTMVFAKVRHHAKLSYRTRLRREAKDRRLRFKKACAAWRRINRWHGAWRVDFIDVYCDGDNRTVVDHIMFVKEYNNDKK